MSKQSMEQQSVARCLVRLNELRAEKGKPPYTRWDLGYVKLLEKITNLEKSNGTQNG